MVFRSLLASAVPERGLWSAISVWTKLFVLARDASGAETSLAWLKAQLRQRWSVDLSDSSLEVLSHLGTSVLPARFMPP